MSRKNKKPLGTAVPRKTQKISRNEGLNALARFQRYMGFTLIASSVLGVYLLASDHSLWLLAVSHAYGLVFIVVVDLILGALNFLSMRQAYIPSIAWGVLTLALQLGDILTAPQYRMTVPYFAKYLFGLWAFDLLLAAQVVLVVVGLYGRAYLQYRVKKKLSYFDMTSKSSRRDFLQIGGGIALLVAIAAVLGIANSFDSGQSKISTGQSGNTLPSGAIANVGNLTPLSPVYFEFPSGHPSVLFKKSDGTLSALSMLCTHVCCQTTFMGNGQLYCPCHGSLFSDLGDVLRGPASTPLPSIELTTDSSGNIFPKSVKGTSPCLG